jgi:hypothetical protein
MLHGRVGVATGEPQKAAAHTHLFHFAGLKKGSPKARRSPRGKLGAPWPPSFTWENRRISGRYGDGCGTSSRSCGPGSDTSGPPEAAHGNASRIFLQLAALWLPGVAVARTESYVSSIAWDIVTQQHGGTIEVDSRVGEFTEFTIRLPRQAMGGAA